MATMAGKLFKKRSLLCLLCLFNKKKCPYVLISAHCGFFLTMSTMFTMATMLFPDTPIYVIQKEMLKP